MENHSKHIIILILASGFMCLVVASLQGAESYPFKEQSTKASEFFSHFRSEISIKDPVLESEKVFFIESRFFNSDGGQWFYNAFLQPLTPQPVVLALYDHNKIYLRDLIAYQGGSRTTITSKNWTYVPGDSSVGTSLRVVIQELPPGEYFLQMIYRSAFTYPNPAEIISNPQMDEKFYIAEFMKSGGREIFRSNVLKITLK